MTELLSIAPTLTAPEPNWEIKRAEHERHDAELRAVNKTAVFDALAAAGITIVIVAFVGYGDSGQIENVEAKAGEDLVALPSGEVEIASARLGRPRPSPNAQRSPFETQSKVSHTTFSSKPMAAGRTTKAPMANSPSMSSSARSRSITTSGSKPPNIPSTCFEEATMGHCYHHALSSVKKWGGVADDYLPLHQWFDESKAITADFRHRALRHHAEGIFMLERFFGSTITIGLPARHLVPVRLIGEQHVGEDLGFIPSFVDWVRCIRPEPWMGRAQPIHRDVDPFARRRLIILLTLNPSKPGRLAGLSHFWRPDMADYLSPTVIQQPIPVADMTLLERLVLSLIFDAEPDGEALYFHASLGPSDAIGVSIDDLRMAFEASARADSTAATYVAERLAAVPADDTEIEIDFSGTSWEFIFQDVVRRSATLRYVTAVTSFTCSKMRPDGFGGMAVLITADAILGKSTNDILEDFLAEKNDGGAGRQRACP